MMNMALFLLFTHSHLFSAVGIASIVMSYITSRSPPKLGVLPTKTRTAA